VSSQVKIAVYTIALNEQKHVTRWFDSAKDADLLLIADTGSSDNTKYIAKSLGISIHDIEVNPWRFDVARNASLALIPEEFDICIQLDMDEVLPPGWRVKVEQAFREGNVWPIYKHVTSRYPDGSARASQLYFKIHPRKGFYWKYPIHEILVHEPTLQIVRKEIDLEVDHLQDVHKSRSSYLNLLEIAVQEDPSDWRMNHYLNREYFYVRDWLRVLQTAYKCEKIRGGWDVERASTYMWASEAALNLKLPGLAEYWAELSTEAAPNFYEAWHWRAHIAHLNNEWFDCLHYASKILYLNRQSHHLVKPAVWEWWGYDLMALSNYKLENFQEALIYGERALAASPENSRLKENLRFYVQDQFESEKKPAVSVSEKLRNLPKLFVINLDESESRLENLKIKLEKFEGIIWERCTAVNSPSKDQFTLNDAVKQSHLSAIQKFLSDRELKCAIICEDDLSLETLYMWNFTWEELQRRIDSAEIDILQLVVITKSTSTFQGGLRRRREGIDWSSGAYYLTRQGAEKILAKNCHCRIQNGITEPDLFDSLNVFSFPIFVCDSQIESTLHQDHVEKYHIPSFANAKASLQRRANISIDSEVTT
jgi:glycosyltransferase involved in cell wall biosynthesis